MTAEAATPETARPQVPAGYRCLVIGPIGSALAPIDSEENRTYTESIEVLGTVIEPACHLFGITPIRADNIRNPSEIPDQVYRAIRDWDLVIADLTGANPNVMYELALRHMTGKCAIAISEYKRLPFDVSYIRTEQFVRSEAGLIAGRERLIAAIHAALTTGCDELTVGRIFAVLRGGAPEAIPSPEPLATAEEAAHEEAGSTSEPAPAGETPVQDPDAAVPSREDDEPPGLLDIIVEAEEALPELSTNMQRITAVIETIGNQAEAGNNAITDAESKGPLSARDRLLLAAATAARFDDSAAELETLVSEYSDRITRLDRANTFILDRIEEDEDAQATNQEYLQAIATLGETSVTSLESARGLARNMDLIGRTARVLRGPASRIAGSLRSMSEVSSLIVGWGDRARGMLQDTGPDET